jgi:hypothetical protein
VHVRLVAMSAGATMVPTMGVCHPRPD